LIAAERIADFCEFVRSEKLDGLVATMKGQSLVGNGASVLLPRTVPIVRVSRLGGSASFSVTDLNGRSANFNFTVWKRNQDGLPG
jgi:hypothetical protein